MEEPLHEEDVHMFWLPPEEMLSVDAKGGDRELPQ